MVVDSRFIKLGVECVGFVVSVVHVGIRAKLALVGIELCFVIFKIFLVEFFNEKTRKTITFIGFEYRSYT